MFLLLARSARDYISVISPQVNYQRLQHTAVERPLGRRTPITEATDDASVQLSPVEFIPFFFPPGVGLTLKEQFVELR